MAIKNEKSVFMFGNEYRCVGFTDVAPDVSGVEIFRNDESLGKIVGLNIPDIEDEEENIKFDIEINAWLVENE